MNPRKRISTELLLLLLSATPICCYYAFSAGAGEPGARQIVIGILGVYAVLVFFRFALWFSRPEHRHSMKKHRRKKRRRKDHAANIEHSPSNVQH